MPTARHHRRCTTRAAVRPSGHILCAPAGDERRHAVTDVVDRLVADGVEFVQVLYTELHGVCRGKEVPIERDPPQGGAGIGHHRGDHDHRPRPQRHRRLRARLPRHLHRPRPVAGRGSCRGSRTTAWCLGDIQEVDGTPYAADPRHAVRRAVDALAEPRPARRRRARARVLPRRPGHLRGVHARTSRASTPSAAGRPARRVPRDPRATRATSACCPSAARRSTGAASTRSTWRTARRSRSPTATFMFKTMVKQTAARHGLLATFMGKVRGRRGLGHARPHLAASATTAPTPSTTRRGRRADRHRAPVRRRHPRPHARADGVPLPDGQRVPPHGGREPRADARQLGPRQPPRDAALPGRSAARPRASRCGVGDGAAAIHNAVAAHARSPASTGWSAGSSCRRPCARLPVRGRGRRSASRCPRRSATRSTRWRPTSTCASAMGGRLVEIFDQIKRYELDRWHAHLAKVTDWERNEYAHHL